MISRGAFLASITGGLVAVSLAAEAQQAGKVSRVGFLWDCPAVWPHALEGFRRGLRDLGWVEGQKTARALGLTIPLSMLSRVDRVIE